MFFSGTNTECYTKLSLIHLNRIWEGWIAKQKNEEWKLIQSFIFSVDLFYLINVHLIKDKYGCKYIRNTLKLAYTIQAQLQCKCHN